MSNSNITPLEQEIYLSIATRCKFVGLNIKKLCRLAKISPSTFSRWVNGHNCGYIKTVGRMDEILRQLEAKKFEQFKQRAADLDMSVSDLCKYIETPMHDYVRWENRILEPNYKKLSMLEGFLKEMEKRQFNQ